MKTIFTLLLFLVSSISQAQTTIGRQKVDQFPINSTGTLTYGLTWLPLDYNSNPSRFPLIIFLHGAGEVGKTVSSLDTLIKQNPAAIPRRIAEGWNATAVNPTDGKTYEFIVCTPQAPAWSYNYNQLKYILPDIMRRYRVDPTRVYITGLSAGAEGIWTVMGSGDDDFIKKFAAFVSISTTGVSAVNGLTDTLVRKNVDAGRAAIDGVNAWAVTGSIDEFAGFSNEYMNAYNNASPSRPGKLTVIGSAGHSEWEYAYDPAWRPTSNYYGINGGTAKTWPAGNNGSPVAGCGLTQDSLNVYEWLLLSRNTKNLAGNGQDTAGGILLLYPNPATDNISLQINNSQLGTMNVQLVDRSGAIINSYIFNKDQPIIQVNLPIRPIPFGTYFIRVQIGGWKDVRKILKI